MASSVYPDIHGEHGPARVGRHRDHDRVEEILLTLVQDGQEAQRRQLDISDRLARGFENRARQDVDTKLKLTESLKMKYMSEKLVGSKKLLTGLSLKIVQL